MLNYLIYFSALVLYVQASGEFNVLTHPPSAIFKGHDHLEESLLPEIYSVNLGFTTEQDSNWQGLYLSDPFNLAKAIVTVVIDGVTDIGLVKGHSFPLKTDQDELEIYNEMVRRLKDRHPNARNDLRIVLSNGLLEVEDDKELSSIKNIKANKQTNSFLKLSIEEDKQFLEELAFLNAIIEKVKMSTADVKNLPYLTWIKVSTLHALSDLHGENSTQTKEAKRLLASAIEELNAAYSDLYGSEILINVITSDASHTRRVRREAPVTPKAEDNNWNLAKNYSSDYPVIFNIILWFGVTMVFTLLAICLFIGNMDPGRDSIIYRMTSTRMKKDN